MALTKPRRTHETSGAMDSRSMTGPFFEVPLGWRYQLFGMFVREIDSEKTDMLDLSGKVMGLNAYGVPTERDVRWFENWFKMDYPDYLLSFDPNRNWFLELLGSRALNKDSVSARDQWFLNLVASMQEAFSRTICALAQQALVSTGSRSIVLSGGCALNVLTNSRVARLDTVERFFVQPNSGDGGLPLGAAAIGSSRLAGFPLHHPDAPLDARRNPYMGVSLVDDLPNDFLDGNIECRAALASDRNSAKTISRLLLNNRIVALVTGTAEVGPRALGHRSILAIGGDPRMRDVLNKVKCREWWRPFAPVCRAIDVERYFEGDLFSPYMLTAAIVRPEFRSALASASHEDGTARVQVLPHRTANPLL